MSDKMSQYYEAYYGTPIPASQSQVIHKPFSNMVCTLIDDINDLLPDASEEMRKEGILEALRYMNSTGETHIPDVYVRNTRIATEAFRFAIAAAKGKPIRRERTPKEVQDAIDRQKESVRNAIDEYQASDAEIKQRLATRDKVASEVYEWYKSQKYSLIKAGIGADETHEAKQIKGEDYRHEPTEAKVRAYELLLDQWHSQGGIDYYVVAMQIPTEEGIYDHPRVIEANNKHPHLRDRKPSQLRVYGKGSPFPGMRR